MNFSELPEEGVEPSDIQAASPHAPDGAAGVAVRDAAPSAALPLWVEATDEMGLAVVFRRDAVALARAAGPSLGDVRSIMIMNSGTIIPLRTSFSSLIERLKGE